MCDSSNVVCMRRSSAVPCVVWVNGLPDMGTIVEKEGAFNYFGVDEWEISRG